MTDLLAFGNILLLCIIALPQKNIILLEFCQTGGYLSKSVLNKKKASLQSSLVIVLNFPKGR